jgi:hypothetical protein
MITQRTSATTSKDKNITFHLPPLILLSLSLVLYLSTLDNGFQPHELHGGDLITHQYAQVQARPSNAPGYPFYTMGGFLWFHTLHPLIAWLSPELPNPIPILSSYSTLWALLALLCLYVLTAHVCAQQGYHGWLIPWLATAFFTVTYFFWYYATTTEQYSSAVAHLLVIFYLYTKWRRSPPPNYLYLFLLAFFSGLSLSHMLTIALVVPPLVAVILFDAPFLLRDWRAMTGSILAAALPLVGYIYVYVRGASNPHWWGTGSWTTPEAWFWDFVSTSQGREELLWGFEPDRDFWGNGFPELIWHELSLPLLLLGLIGIALLRRHFAMLLYGTLALHLLFCWAYRYGNWYQVIIPAYPIVIIGVAACTSRLSVALHRAVGENAFLRPNWPHRALPFLPHICLLIALLWRIDSSLPAANSRNRPGDTALNSAAILLDQPIPTNAALFAGVDEALALQYLTTIWAIRDDLKVATTGEAAGLLMAGKCLFVHLPALPLFLSEQPSNLHANLHVDGVSPDWMAVSKVGSAGCTVDASDLLGISPSAAIDDISLHTYSVRTAPQGKPVLTVEAPAVDLTLYWDLPGGDWPEEWSISVRPQYNGAYYQPVDPADGTIIQYDRPGPVLVRLAHPLHTRGDHIVTDSYRLTLPNGSLLPTTAEVVIYRQAEGQFQNLAEIVLPLPSQDTKTTP